MNLKLTIRVATCMESNIINFTKINRVSFKFQSQGSIKFSGHLWTTDRVVGYHWDKPLPSFCLDSTINCKKF